MANSRAFMSVKLSSRDDIIEINWGEEVNEREGVMVI